MTLIKLSPRRMVGALLDPTTGCWNWTGAVGANGYGRMGRGRNRVMVAHVVYFEHFRGPVPPGLELDHLCRNRRCVNPDHLEPVTRTINAWRGARSKLTIEKAGEIRRRYAAGGVTMQALGDEYGVHSSVISRVVTNGRNTWKPQ